MKLEDSKVIKRVTEVLFILKWGGELTHSGVSQAIEFGKAFNHLAGGMSHFSISTYPTRQPFI